MRRRFGLATLVAAVLFAVAYSLWASQDDGSAAGPAWRVHIPGIAMDSVPPVSSTRQVVVAIDLDILEPAFAGQGQTLVKITAVAHGPLPGQFDPPVTVSGSATITTHPADVCGWMPEVVQSNFTMTYSQPQGSTLSLKIDFSGLEWHYQVQCPDAKPIRFPAGNVNESLTGWLGLIFPGLGGPGGATIQTPAVSGGQACVKRKGVTSNTNTWGTGTVEVWVTQPPCLIAVE